MGVSINNVTVAELKDGIDFLLEGEKLNAPDVPVAVRTADGVDGHFYLDVDSGRFLITPESFYMSGRAKRKAKKAEPKKETLTAAERSQLADAFYAILGVASEHGPEVFNSYNKPTLAVEYGQSIGELESVPAIKRIVRPEKETN